MTPAEVQDNQPALDLLWRTRFRWKLRPRQVTGDTKYGTVENIVAIEDQASACLSAAVGGGPARRDVSASRTSATTRRPMSITVPADKVLRFLSQCDATHRRIYQATAADCKACALRAQCTTSQRGRRISRDLDETYLDRVRGYHETEAYAKAMRKRKVWVEPLFAEAKEWHGLRRFRLRVWTRSTEAVLIAAGQNLKRLLVATRSGRRHDPPVGAWWPCRGARVGLRPSLGDCCSGLRPRAPTSRIKESGP